MSFHMVTTCTSALSEDIHELQELATDIDLSDLLEFAQKEGIYESLLEDFNIHEFANQVGKTVEDVFTNDPTIDASVSLYQGVPCFYVRHSHIEHIYIHNSLTGNVLSHDEAEKRVELIDELETKLDEYEPWLQASTIAQNKSALLQFFKDNRQELVENNIPLQSLCSYAHKHLAKHLDDKRFSSEFSTLQSLLDTDFEHDNDFSI